MSLFRARSPLKKIQARAAPPNAKVGSFGHIFYPNGGHLEGSSNLKTSSTDTTEGAGGGSYIVQWLNDLFYLDLKVRSF